MMEEISIYIMPLAALKHTTIIEVLPSLVVPTHIMPRAVLKLFSDLLRTGDKESPDTYNAACGVDSKIASPAGAGEVASAASR